MFEEIEDVKRLEPAAEVFVVAVQSAEPVSKEIERRFALRHESPQVLIVHAGAVVWHASHFRLTREEIISALGAIASRSGSPDRVLPR